MVGHERPSMRCDDLHSLVLRQDVCIQLRMQTKPQLRKSNPMMSSPTMTCIPAQAGACEQSMMQSGREVLTMLRTVRVVSARKSTAAGMMPLTGGPGSWFGWMKTTC